MRLTLSSVYKREGGVEALYELLRERSTEADPHVNISHRRLPSFQEHQRFVRSRPYRAWLFVKADGLVAGNLTITKLNEIGIVLSADYRGKGVGRWAVGELLRRFRPLPAIPAARSGRFVANINPKNERSIRLFTGLGAVLLQQTYEFP